jgi:hypothetical protein
VKVATEGIEALVISNCRSNLGSCSPPFTAQCEIGKGGIELYALVDTCAQEGNYIHFETAQVLSNIDATIVRALDKLMKINGFNGKAALNIKYTILVPLCIGRH